MAIKITPADIIQINNLYLQLKTYAAVAREMGISAGTVKKYVDPNYSPYDASNEIHFTLDMLPEIGSGVALFRNIENFGDLCVLSEQEKEEVRAMSKELR